MKIVFFEVQDWEKELLKFNFPDSEVVTERLSPELALKYEDAEVMSCFVHSEVKKETIDKLQKLKYIATRSTGYDHIDVGYCKDRGIQVVNVPEYGSATVAEHTFALLLSLTRKIYQSVNQSKELNFDHEQIRGVDLEGKTIGVIGLGKIGQKVAKIAAGFGMKVLAYNRSEDPNLIRELDLKYVDLNTLLANSDVISLHLPLNNETKHLLNKENIVKCKKGSFLVNTARGGLIETEAILLGLDEGIFEGVGLDVLEEEEDLAEELEMLTSENKTRDDLKGLVFNHILINHPKVLITPHNAFNSKEALLRIAYTTIENIKSYLMAKPINIVS